MWYIAFVSSDHSNTVIIKNDQVGILISVVFNFDSEDARSLAHRVPLVS